MEYKHEIIPSDALYHHGIKGMRWGIRRFQNKDGSLTPAGQKRRSRLEGELAQLKGKKTRSKAGETKTKKEEPRKKTVSEMTDDEVRARINRMQLEKNYYDTAKSLAQSNPKKVSAGKRFLNTLGKDVLAPAAVNAGKAWAENFLKEKLGLNKKSTLERLKEEYDILDYKKKIKGAKNDMRDMDDDELSGLKKRHDILDYQKKIEKLEKGEPSLKEIVSDLNSLSSEEREALVTAAGIKYYAEAARGKGAKPDKDKKDKKEEDDD